MIGDFLEVGRGGVEMGIELQMEVDLKISTVNTCKNQGVIILKRHPIEQRWVR